MEVSYFHQKIPKTTKNAQNTKKSSKNAQNHPKTTRFLTQIRNLVTPL